MASRPAIRSHDDEAGGSAFTGFPAREMRLLLVGLPACSLFCQFVPSAGGHVGETGDRCLDDVPLCFKAVRFGGRDVDVDADPGGLAVVEGFEPPLKAQVGDEAGYND